MPLPAIIVSIGSSLLSILASKSVETAVDPVLSKLKDKLTELFGLGKYEAIQRALEGAREDVLQKFATSAERASVGQVLNSIFDIKPSPFVDEFAKQINRDYLLSSPTADPPQYLAESFHLMVKESSSTPPITNLENTSTSNLFCDFFLVFRERLLKEEDFAYLREYYHLLEARQQTNLQKQMLDGIERIAANTAKQMEDFDAIRKEYFSYLARELSAHTIRGFAPQVGGRRVISLPLAKIFVPLRAVEGRPTLAEYAEEDLFRQAANEVNRELENDHHWQHHFRSLERRFALLEIRQEAEKPLTLAELLKSSRAILLGDPGTGKTTITRYVTYSLAVNDLTHVGSDMAGRVPVLVRIANFAKAFEQDSTLHIIEYVAKELTSRPEFGNYLRWAIEQNRCLVILDGLDEVSDSGLRIRVTDRIQNMVASFSGNYYLVTSRIVGYDQSPLTQEFQHATLQELTDEDKNRFIRLWYDAIDDEIGSGTHTKGATDLITALRNKPQISRMAANPLLLTIMVLMHWRGTKLPSRRVQVYQTATDTLIEYWTAQREGVDLDAEEIKNILAPIAHYILSSNVSGVIAHQDLLPRFFQGIVQERGYTQEEQARRIGREMLKDLNEQSGLFLERGLDVNNQPVYGFLHQTFGEYLAALYLAQDVQKSSFALKEYIHQSIWHEPLLLLFGHLSLYSRPQAEMLMRQLLDYPALYEETLQRNLLFAADCLGDGIQIEPMLRDEILEKLAKLIQHPVSQIRDAAIERYKNIAATHHRDAAVLALKKCCNFDDNNKLDQMSKNARFDLANALIYLKEHQAAQPIVWQLDEDNYGNSVRRLRFEHWPELATDYLLQLQADNEYDFSVSAGKDLSSSTLGPVDAGLARRILGEKNLIALSERLAERIVEDNDKATLQWIAVLAAENPSYESMLKLTQPEIPSKIRNLVATKLLKSEHRANAMSLIQNWTTDMPEEANAAVQAFLEVGERGYVDKQLLRDTAVYAFYGNSYEAIINLLKMGDKEFALPVVLFFWAGNNRNWKLVESLLEHNLKDIALAAVEWMALSPGYVYRWKACEALLKAGRVKEAIPLMLYLAYECQDKGGHQAIEKLIMLGEGERVKPLLWGMTQSATASERYQASLALAKLDSSLLPEGLDVPKRIDLKVKILEERTQAHKDAIRKLCQVGVRILADTNSNDEHVEAVKKLAYYNLARFADSNNVSVNIPTVNLVELLESTSPIVRLRASLYAAEKGLFDQTSHIYSDILSHPEKSVSIQVQARAISLQVYFKLKKEQPQEIYKALTNQSAPVRQRAAWCLGLLGESSSIPPLVSALNDDNAKTRRWIASALGLLGNPDAASQLIQLLGDKEGNVRSAASVALGQLGDVVVTPHLTKMLTDEDRKVRLSASYALWLLGDSTSIPALLVALKDDDNRVRASAAYLLGEFSESSATQFLVIALNDKDKKVRSSAARALGRLGDKSAVPVLIDTLNDKNSGVRRSAILALGELGDLIAGQPLNSMLLDKDESVRTAAIRTLKQLGAPINMQAIVAALEDKKPEKRAAAVHILVLENMDSAFESLVTLLNDVDVTVQEWANWGFGYLGEFEAIQFLQNSLKNESANMRRLAVQSLGQLGNSSVVPSLIIMLGDYNSSVRERAAWALGQIGDSLAVRPLIALLNDNDDKVRKSATFSLGRLNDKIATESLLLALRDASKEVRRSAAVAISRVGDPIAIPHLYDGFESIRLRAMARMKVLDAIPHILFFSAYGDEINAKDNSFSLVHLDPVAALTMLEQCGRRFPKKSWVHNLRGHALWKVGDTNAAKENFHKALELDSEDTTNLLALVHFYLEHGELLEAIKYAKNTVLYSPDSAICLLTYAVTLRLQGETEMASAQLRKARLQNRHVTNTDDLQFEHFWREKALSALEELSTYESTKVI